MLFCNVTFNLWLHFNKLLTYYLSVNVFVTDRQTDRQTNSNTHGVITVQRSKWAGIRTLRNINTIYHTLIINNTQLTTYRTDQF